MQWMILFRKEILESWRNFKWIWVPLVFILLSIIDPLSTYYLPQILKATGGLPEGATINIPTPPSGEIFMMSISQLNTIGLLVIALISMGTIAGERKSGVAELILVKPVSYFSYVTAKWAAHVFLVLVALLLGLLSSWYYVNLLFGEVSFASFGSTFCFYGLWIALVLAISLFMNTLSKSPGLVLFFTMGSLITLSTVSRIFSHLIERSPSLMTGYLREMVNTGNIGHDLWGAAGITAGSIILLLFFATFTLKRKEIA
ncbi:ABC transporter permease [Halobacillus sp. BBL2006]|uniref:ABC transporter permease n=1 Tax=Halobacillus sp. BBL2006 TaxID=1543706 RepID=UPI0006904033|nr:ABC transporter permease subunit [Halobacillus sp. BBL2006]